MLVGAPIMPYLPMLSKDKRKVWSLCNNSLWFYSYYCFSCSLWIYLWEGYRREMDMYT